MTTQKIKTQAELDSAIKAGGRDFEFVAKGTFEINLASVWVKVSVALALKREVLVVARGSSHVEAWGSSHVEARESSHVVARESSHVVAWGSSHVEARESSHVVARESSHVVASGFVALHVWGKVKAKISVKCHAFIHSKEAKVTGGKKTEAILSTSQDWCDYYGVKVERGLARVYKALNEGFSSHHDSSFKYIPDTKPKAPSFDTIECSNGLHFSPTPSATKRFNSNPKHFVECWVKVSDMLVFFNGQFPDKCKAPAVMRPVIEVDVYGKPMKQKEAA